MQRIHPFSPLSVDSYKIGHWNMMPAGTEVVYSYAEARVGGEFEELVFFGLQPYLDGLSNFVASDIGLLRDFCKHHFGNETIFNEEGWVSLIKKHGRNLPLIIKAVPEGTIVKPGDVLFTVENTDPEFPWLTQYVESYLQKVWYPITVASLSRKVKKMFAEALRESTGDIEGLDWKLHDFGFRGASSEETAAIGGAAHLVNFKGSDTISGALFLVIHYADANEPDEVIAEIANSVPASEHSVMTALGEEGESQIVGELLKKYPTGILSVVADSYDIYHFVENIVCKQYKNKILERNGTFVVRPDSCSPRHPNPEDQVLWIYETLWEAFGGTVTDQKYMLLNPKVNVLWGDGIGPEGVQKIIDKLIDAGFVPTFVAGMGGGLLQKVNRDTIRFAIKSSAQKRDGVWYDVVKNPLDKSKKSKAGRFDHPSYNLHTVFENGRVVKTYDFREIRERANQNV